MDEAAVNPEVEFMAISEEEVKKCQEAYAQGGETALQQMLQKKADEWKTIPLNIGIIGISGSGKSTFINTIRDLTAEDDGAAGVGVTETTSIPTPYSHPKNELLVFWDLPGVGTPAFPKDTYLDQIGFSKFDFFLIMTKDRFYENDLWIAREIEQQKKQFFFVRSNIHNNIANDKKDRPKSHNADAVLTTIRNDIKVKLGDMHRENGTFLIDSHERTLYDFDLLKQRITDSLTSLKRAAFILSVSTLSEAMVKKKVEVLRSGIWTTAALSAIVAVVPMSLIVNWNLILKTNKFYFQQLGLDEESLKRTADVMSCDIGDLHQIIQKPKEQFLTGKGLLDYMDKIPWFMTVQFAGFCAGFVVPILGSVVASPSAVSSTYRLLSRVLIELEKTALEVLRAAAESTKDDGRRN